MICGRCKKKVYVGNVWWVHDGTNDTWCDPKQNQFAVQYNIVQPEFEESN